MIKPKYNALDEMWVMYDNKPKKVGIYGIYYTKPHKNNNNSGDVEKWNYGIIDYDISVDGVVLPNVMWPSGDLHWYEEDKVFPTKEELLNSL